MNKDHLFLVEVFALLFYLFIVGCVLTSLGVIDKEIKTDIYKMFNVPEDK